jgi:hypothetical protein
MSLVDEDEDEVDTTSPISPIAPCTPYRESSQKLEIEVRPRQSPMFSPTKLGNIGELSDEEIELMCLISPTPGDLKQPEKSKKSVTFNKRVKVQKILHINDFSQQRVDDIWFTKSEYNNLKAEALETCQLMLAGKPLGKDQSSKGLEYKLPAVYERRQQDKHTHLHSVLDEQDQQWASLIDDDQRIADISRMRTAEHRAAARTRGLVAQEDIAKPGSKTRKSKSSKLSTSVPKSPSSQQSREELLKNVKSIHTKHDRIARQMTLLSAAA